MAFALQCLGPKFPDPVARDFNPTTPLNAYRGEAPSPVLVHEEIIALRRCGN
jgi:hypothetical protein